MIRNITQRLEGLKPRGRGTWLLIFLAVYMGSTGQTFAITQRDLVTEGIDYFRLSVDCDGTSASFTGSDNIQIAFNFLATQSGMNAVAASGIVGNLMAESSVNPQSVQGGKNSLTLPPSIFGSAGYGIAQWTSEGRQKNLIAFAQQMGKQEGTMEVQLPFLWKEATTGYKTVLDHVEAATTPEDAAMQWMGPNISGPNDSGGFENPRHDVDHADVRRSNARNVYQKYASQVPGPSGGTVATAATPCGASNPGAFIEYKQCSYNGKTVPWADVPYGSGNVCSSGCGPSAMAMIITNLTGTQVTPGTTAAYGDKNGTVYSGGGSSWNIADVIGSHWGLKSQELGTDIQKINNALQNGALVLASGTGPDPFTKEGHFIVIRAVTPDGKWMTGNSANYDSSKPYDPQQVMQSIIRHGDTWALTKTTQV